ncbi:hypothetical protein [Salinarimonas sp.]|uniref:hypothetical protein n=1 Tax=Salinarimonas sp. TaxID=2766526 RepID=UPI0032D9A2DB
MIVMSHRGYWKSAIEKNSPRAFARSFDLGFGTETDLRDCDGRLVVSHDPPGEHALDADALLELHARTGPHLPLALNIKADGLQDLVVAALRRRRIETAFVFDMSVPDMLRWSEREVPVFTRHSDIEPEPALYANARGVWLDAFRADWWTPETIRGHLDRGKRVCVVSPELHGRPHRPVWDRLARSPLARADGLMLCTDFPEEACEVFGYGH